MSQPSVNARRRDRQRRGASCTPLTQVDVRAFGAGLLVQVVSDTSPQGGAVVPVSGAHRLMLVLGGAMKLEKRETPGGRWQTRLLRDGDLHIAGAGSPGYEIDWQSADERPLQLVHVHLDPGLTARLAAEHGRGVSGRELRVRVGARDGLIQQLCAGLARAVKQPRGGDDAFADHAAELLGLQLLREHAEQPLRVPPARGALTPARLRLVQDLVAARLDTPLRLCDLAGAVGLTTYHFARAFKQATGETPHAYLLRRRIEQARTLLADDRPIAEVAQLVGFASQAHFTTQFRRLVGTTPARWRRG